MVILTALAAIIIGLYTFQKPEKHEAELDAIARSTRVTDTAFAAPTPVIPTPSSAAGLEGVYYVSLRGSDTNAGTESQPWKTLNYAASKLEAGDTLLIRGGTYYEILKVLVSGNEKSPIEITNYKGEEVILDGTVNGVKYQLPSRNGSGALATLKGDYLILSNITTRFSGDRGVNVLGQHDRVKNVYAYENWGSGIFMNSNYNTAEGNRARSNSMKFYYYTFPDPVYPSTAFAWSTGITCARYPLHCVLRNNTAWDNWGHGISTYEAEYTTMEGNVSYNNMKLNIYVSDAKYTLTKNNLAYCTPGNSRNTTADNFQFGIYVGDEDGVPEPFPTGSVRVPSSDNQFYNNLVIGCDKNLSTKAGISTNDLFAYNTLVNADISGNVNFEIRGGNCTNCRFQNNVILQENATVMALNVGSGFTFSNNLWSSPPPSNLAGLNDVIGNPLLQRSGPFSPGLLSPDYFRLMAGSPAIDQAKALAEVSQDFFNALRTPIPDIGALEYKP